MKNLKSILPAFLICLYPILTLSAQPEDYGACIMKEGALHGTHIDRHYPMFSVMKFPQALYVARQLEKKGCSPNATVTVCKSELMADTWSPMLGMFTDDTRDFTVTELLALSLQQSDNNACDLLFQHFGKPRKTERYMTRLGFKDIRIRKTERQMNERPACAAENSCTPAEMVRLLEWFYRHKDDNASLHLVWTLMSECRTGEKRIPAALPENAVLVHKTGTGFRDAQGRCPLNDAGIILLPDGSHLPIAVFIRQASDESQVAEAARLLLE